MSRRENRRVSVWLSAVVLAVGLSACAGRSPVAPSDEHASAAGAPSSTVVAGLRATASICPSFRVTGASVVGGVLTVFVDNVNCVPVTGANVLVRVPFTTTAYTFPIVRQGGVFFPGYIANSVGFAFTRGECRLLTVINPDGQRSNDFTYCRPAN